MTTAQISVPGATAAHSFGPCKSEAHSSYPDATVLHNSGSCPMTENVSDDFTVQKCGGTFSQRSRFGALSAREISDSGRDALSAPQSSRQFPFLSASYKQISEASPQSSVSSNNLHLSSQIIQSQEGRKEDAIEKSHVGSNERQNAENLKVNPKKRVTSKCLGVVSSQPLAPEGFLPSDFHAQKYLCGINSKQVECAPTEFWRESYYEGKTKILHCIYRLVQSINQDPLNQTNSLSLVKLVSLVSSQLT